MSGTQETIQPRTEIVKKEKAPHQAGQGFTEGQDRENQRRLAEQNPMANKSNPGQRAEEHRGRLADMSPSRGSGRK